MIQSEAMNEAQEVDAGRDRAVGGGQIRIFVFIEAKMGPTRTPPAVPIVACEQCKSGRASWEEFQFKKGAAVALKALDWRGPSRRVVFGPLERG